MAYIEITGNIFNSKAGALVNTVNCVGAMGKGIALEFRRRYPNMFERYHQDCLQGKLKPGQIYAYPETDVLILNFAIKNHWKFPSKIEWIDASIRQFVIGYKQRNIRSVAFPWMGAMNGGIPLEQIQTIMRRYLRDGNLPDIEIEVYSFDPDASDPLFETLKLIAAQPNPIELFSDSGLQKRAVESILNALQKPNTTSLYRLEESKVVGTTSINKLYKFLTDQKNKGQMRPLGPRQLNFFGNQ
jgi:O-acetyl-ADP-ribose deacetylase (regulator of RNase III)